MSIKSKNEEFENIKQSSSNFVRSLYHDLQNQIADLRAIGISSIGSFEEKDGFFSIALYYNFESSFWDFSSKPHGYEIHVISSESEKIIVHTVSKHGWEYSSINHCEVESDKVEEEIVKACKRIKNEISSR